MIIKSEKTAGSPRFIIIQTYKHLLLYSLEYIIIVSFKYHICMKNVYASALNELINIIIIFLRCKKYATYLPRY